MSMEDPGLDHVAPQPQPGQYRFVNEDPTWRYRDLIFDEAPEMVEQRRRAHENWAWEPLNIRQPEHLEKLYGIVWTLMKLPPSQRRKEVRREPHGDPRLADLLLKESEKVLARGVVEAADDRARTAEWIAGVLPAGCAAVSEIRARARTLQAAARQLVGQPQGADSLFRSALDDLAECQNPSTWAFFFKTLARVREQQRRLPEAAAFLSRAVELYRQPWPFTEPFTDEQGCLRRLGRLYLRLNDPGRAMEALAQVRIENASNQIQAEVLLGRATCLAAVDLREPARRLLQQSRAERRRIRSRAQRLPLEWWDARVTLHLGDLEDAIPRLDGVRQEHLRSKRWAEACSASVELLLAYARTGNLERTGRPDVFGQLSRALEEDRELAHYLPFAEDREPLEAGLRAAIGPLKLHGFPEASACETFLEHVQSLPPSRSAAAILHQQSPGSDWQRPRPFTGTLAQQGSQLVQLIAARDCAQKAPRDPDDDPNED